MKTFLTLPLLISGLFLGSSAFANEVKTDQKTDQTIDCMVHDSAGAMLADLGQIGTLMDGSYKSSATFTYKTLTILADLNGPFTEAPEVASPQMKLVVMSSGRTEPVALAVTSVVDGFNLALWEPTTSSMIHCTKMSMHRNR